MVSYSQIFIHEFSFGFEKQYNYCEEMVKLYATKLSVVILPYIINFLPEGVNMYITKVNYQGKYGEVKSWKSRIYLGGRLISAK